LSPRIKTSLVNLAIAILGIAPIAISLATSAFASHLGCEVSQGSVHPCLFREADIGGALYAGRMAWVYSIVTIPLSLTLAVVYNIWRLTRHKSGPTP
jgi:hypothetical protein